MKVISSNFKNLFTITWTFLYLLIIFLKSTNSLKRCFLIRTPISFQAARCQWNERRWRLYLYLVKSLEDLSRTFWQTMAELFESLEDHSDDAFLSKLLNAESDCPNAMTGMLLFLLSSISPILLISSLKLNVHFLCSESLQKASISSWLAPLSELEKASKNKCTKQNTPERRQALRWILGLVPSLEKLTELELDNAIPLWRIAVCRWPSPGWLPSTTGRTTAQKLRIIWRRSHDQRCIYWDTPETHAWRIPTRDVDDLRKILRKASFDKLNELWYLRFSISLFELSLKCISFAAVIQRK